MGNIIVGHQGKYVKTAMETISGSINWYFVKKEVFSTPWYAYLPINDEKVGRASQCFCTELDLDGSYFYMNF